ncbi:uncharacterized protein LOC141698364 [Apium graveolens]|uniref:uncharacterized protein LOC141698364 n=1 Tax=Apium graveolens TaxID=4045 RepID=UPI003D7AD230
MPLECFLKLLAKKKVGAETGGASEGSGDPGKLSAGSAGRDLLSVVGGMAKDSKADVAAKDKKRHREHGSSRSHHHKKQKDASKVVILEDSNPASIGLAVSKKDGLDTKVGSGDLVLDKEKEIVIAEYPLGVEVLEPPKLHFLVACRDYALKFVAKVEAANVGNVFADVGEVQSFVARSLT